jgi:hypothetical protein
MQQIHRVFCNSCDRAQSVLMAVDVACGGPLQPAARSNRSPYFEESFTSCLMSPNFS